MKNEILHKKHVDELRHYHLLLMLVPSIIFALIIALIVSVYGISAPHRTSSQQTK